MKVRKKSPVLEAVKWDGSDEAVVKIRAMGVDAEIDEEVDLVHRGRFIKIGTCFIKDENGVVWSHTEEQLRDLYDIIEPEPEPDEETCSGFDYQARNVEVGREASEQWPDWHLRARDYWGMKKFGSAIITVCRAPENKGIKITEARAYCKKHFGKL